MTIRSLGNETFHREITAESTSLDVVQTQQEQETPPPPPDPQPASVNEAEKASRYQESSLQGLAMRNMVEAGLPQNNQFGIWDADPLLNAKNPMEVAANLAERSVSALTNEQLLQLAESPIGEQTLAELKKTLEDGDMTASRQKQLDRIAAAQFKPGPGMHITANPPDKAAEYEASYLHTVRRTMMESPSFTRTMNEINNGTPPVNIELARGTRTRLDSFAEGKKQVIDLSDLEKMPATPPPHHPESTTQGQVLTHAMREAREAALHKNQGEKAFDAAHKAAVIAENEYRADINQKTMRLVPPLHDETLLEGEDFSTILIHYDDGHSDGIQFDKDRNLTRVNGNIRIPF